MQKSSNFLLEETIWTVACGMLLRLRVKNPGSDGPALGYPWKGIVYRQALMEYWSVEKAKNKNIWNVL